MDSPSPRESLTCGICLQAYTRAGAHQPKILSCLHLLCSSCVTAISSASSSASANNSDTSPGGSTLAFSDDVSSNDRCRVCGITKVHPDKAFDNHRVLALLAVRDMKAGAETAHCDQCDDEERDPAISRCTECEQFLCEAHDIAHRKGRATKSHVRLTIEELVVSRSSSSLARHLTSACSVHNEQALELLCMVDRTLLCRSCVDGAHSGHATQPISTLAATAVSEIDTALTAAMAHERVLRAELESLTTMSLESSQRSSAVIAQIDTAFAQLTRALQQRQNDLHQQVLVVNSGVDRSLEAHRRQVERDLRAREESCTFARAAVVERNDLVLAQLGDVILEHLKQLAGTHESESSSARSSSPVTVAGATTQQQPQPQQQQLTAYDMRFVANELQRVQEAIKSFGTISTNCAAYAPLCVVSGIDTTTSLACGQPARISIVTYDRGGSRCSIGQAAISFHLRLVSEQSSASQHSSPHQRDAGTAATAVPSSPSTSGAVTPRSSTATSGAVTPRSSSATSGAITPRSSAATSLKQSSPSASGGGGSGGASRAVSSHTIVDHHDGSYSILFSINKCGEYALELRINGEALSHQQLPSRVSVSRFATPITLSTNSLSSGENITIDKEDGEQYELAYRGTPPWLGACLASNAMHEGSHYWEVIVAASGGANHVTIGIATEDAFDFASRRNVFATSSRGCIGFYSGGIRGLATAVVPQFQENDRIGVRLEFLSTPDSPALVSFFLNGSKVFESTVPYATYYPAFSLHCDKDRLIVRKASFFLS